VLPYISALLIIILVVAMFPDVAFFFPKMLGLM